MARILIVEDERKISRSLVRGFQAAGYEVVAVATAPRDSSKHRRNDFDCVVLDILLPGRNGLEVLADLRKARNPFRCAAHGTRYGGGSRPRLDSGADDYLVKPFPFAELLARVRGLLGAVAWIVKPCW